MNDGNFRDRMRAFSKHVSPLFLHPDRERIMERIALESERDLRLRSKLKEFKERVPAFLLTRTQGGSGFPMADILRSFFFEYFDRFRHVGPSGFPSSFNVVESFLHWSQFFVAFDLREEREHLLRLDEYVDWYASGSFPDQPGSLREIMPEGVAHSYNLLSPAEDYFLRTADSEVRILGLTLIRHGSELSALLLAGENPPFPPDEEAGVIPDDASGRKGLAPHPSYDVSSRYLPELAGHSRLIMLARFDIDRACYDVRYVNLDVGPSYRVLTDDRSVFASRQERDEMFASIQEQLGRYDELFSALATMIYLPAFFVDRAARVVETKFATELHVRGASPDVRDAVRVLGVSAVPFLRTVRCLGTSNESGPNERLVTPPEMSFESTGHWRPLKPGEIGENKDGQPIVGKTWVERNETWSAQSMKEFVLAKAPAKIDGPDPGFVYVLRSGTHVADLYKIGLTRRDVSTRAAEISGATGVPTGFEELARWSVGNCAKVEAAAHAALARFRVNKRREFFRVDLQTIVATIARIVQETGGL